MCRPDAEIKHAGQLANLSYCTSSCRTLQLMLQTSWPFAAFSLAPIFLWSPFLIAWARWNRMTCSLTHCPMSNLPPHMKMKAFPQFDGITFRNAKFSFLNGLFISQFTLLTTDAENYSTSKWHWISDLS
jgi:hypothetical protein